jgi:hypothetical protein
MHMPSLFDGSKVDLASSSGILRVTIHPRLHGLAGVVAVGVDVVLVMIFYRFWPSVPYIERVVLLVILVASLLGSLYGFVGEEIIEFDSRKLNIRKGFHGWEREREYPITECSSLEWRAGEKGRSYLACKVGGRPIKFGIWLTENDADKILAALQRTLPDVAKRIAAASGADQHFITLGLGR